MTARDPMMHPESQREDNWTPLGAAARRVVAKVVRDMKDRPEEAQKMERVKE